MFKVTALALLIALCNADTSRRLLQTGAAVDPAVPAEPATPAVPAEPVQPTTPAQPAAPAAPAQPVQPTQPQQPARPYNPYCDPLLGSFDHQKCFEYSYMYGGNYYGAPSYNPYGNGQMQQPNMNNPYCNPYSGMADPQKCIQYQYMYQGYGQPQAPAAPPATPGQGQRPGVPSPMNPYCNPYSGMYDQQDCFRSTHGIYW